MDILYKIWRILDVGTIYKCCTVTFEGFFTATELFQDNSVRGLAFNISFILLKNKKKTNRGSLNTYIETGDKSTWEMCSKYPSCHHSPPEHMFSNIKGAAGRVYCSYQVILQALTLFQIRYLS
jgi:hypothetical protein